MTISTGPSQLIHEDVLAKFDYHGLMMIMGIFICVGKRMLSLIQQVEKWKDKTVQLLE